MDTTKTHKIRPDVCRILGLTCDGSGDVTLDQYKMVIRGKISELNGWKEIERCNRSLKRSAYGVELLGLDPLGDHTGGFKEYSLLPDYPNDLNACHEWEEKLTPDEKKEYALVLRDTFSLSLFGVAHATALQRCEAEILRRDK